MANETIEVLRIPGTLFPRGAFDENASYKFLNIVESGGSGYVCLQPCTGIPVTNTAYWFKFCFKGDKGDAFTYADLTAEQKAELVRDATAAAQAAASSAQSAADDAAAALQKFNTIKAAIDALDPTSTEGSIQTLAAKQGLLESEVDALGPEIGHNTQVIDSLADYEQEELQSVNLLNTDDDDFAPNKWIRTNGKLDISDEYNVTGYISCQGGDTFCISNDGVKSAIARHWCFFDANKVSLKPEVPSGYFSSLTTPSDARYFRISYLNSNTKVQIESGDKATRYIPYGERVVVVDNVKLKDGTVDADTLTQELKGQVEAIPLVIKTYEGVNILDPSTIDNGTGEKGTYLNRRDGTKHPSSSNTTCVSDYISIDDNGLCILGISTSGVNGWAQYSDKTESSYISGGKTNAVNRVTGANYIRICLLKDSQQMVSRGTSQREYTPYTPPTQGVNLDSIPNSAIDINKLKEFWRTVVDATLKGKEIVILGDSSMTSDKWPSLLSSIKDTVGFTLYNGAEGGKSWSSSEGSPLAHWNDIKSNIDGDAPIICIGCGGVNITAYTQGYDAVFARCFEDTSEMSNGLDKAIQTIKDIKMEYPKAQIFLQNNWLTLTGYNYTDALKRLKLKEFYEALCDYFGCVLVDVNRGCNIATYTENYEVDSTYPKRWATNDGTHISTAEGKRRVFNVWLGYFVNYLFSIA